MPVLVLAESIWALLLLHVYDNQIDSLFMSWLWWKASIGTFLPYNLTTKARWANGITSIGLWVPIRGWIWKFSVLQKLCVKLPPALSRGNHYKLQKNGVCRVPNPRRARVGTTGFNNASTAIWHRLNIESDGMLATKTDFQVRTHKHAICRS